MYVDDMLVSNDEADHLDDLRETFDTLRKYKMKLNKQNVFLLFRQESS